MTVVTNASIQSSVVAPSKVIDCSCVKFCVPSGVVNDSNISPVTEVFVPKNVDESFWLYEVNAESLTVIFHFCAPTANFGYPAASPEQVALKLKLALPVAFVSTTKLVVVRRSEERRVG